MTDSEYATLFFAEFDHQTRRLRYANCGHYAPLLLPRDNKLERLDSTATVLGLFKEWDCSTEEQQLLPGDVLALNTNGITGSFNDAGEEFGGKRLIEALLRHRELPPEALLAAIVEELSRFSPNERHDDITLIIARCKS